MRVHLYMCMFEVSKDLTLCMVLTSSVFESEGGGVIFTSVLKCERAFGATDR